MIATTVVLLLLALIGVSGRYVNRVNPPCCATRAMSGKRSAAARGGVP